MQTPDNSNDSASGFRSYFEKGELDFSPLDDPNLERNSLLLKFYQASYSSNVNPLTNQPWEGDMDENAILIMGSWPQLDAKKIMQKMEDGTISYEDFSVIFEYWRDRQASNKRISEKQIRLLFENSPKKYPWVLLNEFLQERDTITIPENVPSTNESPDNDLGVNIDEFIEEISNLVKEDQDVFSSDSRVIQARVTFIDEIRGLSYTSEQMAKVIFKHFAFIQHGMGGCSRNIAMLKASNFISLEQTLKELGSGQSDLFFNFVRDHLLKIVLNDNQEI